MNLGNKVLTGILVAQLLVLAVVFWPRATPSVGEAPLLEGVEADQISQVTIRETETEVRLAKQGEEWVLADTGGFPCKAEAVPELLSKLTALRADRLVAETRASHDRLKVADEGYERLVEVVAGDDTHTLYVGSSPSYGVAHVRLAGEDEVYLVSGLSSVDVSARATGWIDTAYVTLDQSQVVAMTLENANGTFAFVKDAQGAWTMPSLAADEPLNTTAVSSMLSRFASLRMAKPLGRSDAGYGTDAPSAVLTVQLSGADGASSTQVLIVGDKDTADGGYAAKWSESPYYVRVAEFNVGEWVDATRDSFIAPPPTPTPSS
jgi:hypothetical protein